MLSSGIMNIGKAAAGVVKNIADVGMQYEAAMSQVAATMNISQTSKEFQQLSAAAKDMGMKTKFSASESAEALNYMALAGYSVADSIKMLPKVLNLAAAGGMEIATTSDMVTDALSALNLSIDYADILIDQMARTSQKSNTSVAQLGDAILTVGGTAKILSGGTNELNAALGVLANNGIKASEGGTALRNIILSLTAGTDKSKKELQKLGIQVADVNGNMLPLDNIMGQLNDKLSTMGDVAKADTLNEIFNKADLKSVQALLKSTNGEFSNLQNEIKNSEGAAKQMAETMENNLKGALTKTKSAVEGIIIGLFEMDLGTGMKGFFDGLSDGLSEIGKHLSKTVKLDTGEILEKEVDFKAAFDVGLNMINNFIKGIIASIPNAVNGMKSVISNLIPAIKENIPILVNNFVEMIKSLVTIIPTMIPDIITGGVLIIHGLLKGLEQIIPLLPKFIWDIITSIVQGLIRNFPLIIDTILTFIRVKLLLAIGGGIKALYGGIVIAFNALFTSLKEWTGKTFPELGKAILKGILNGITGVGSWIMEKGKQLKDELVGGFKKLFGIKSPSKVFAEEVGKFIPQGIAVGVKADIPNSFKKIEYDLNKGLNSMSLNSNFNNNYIPKNLEIVINNPNFTNQNDVNIIMNQMANNLQRIGVV